MNKAELYQQSLKNLNLILNDSELKTKMLAMLAEVWEETQLDDKNFRFLKPFVGQAPREDYDLILTPVKVKNCDEVLYLVLKSGVEKYYTDAMFDYQLRLDTCNCWYTFFCSTTILEYLQNHQVEIDAALQKIPFSFQMGGWLYGYSYVGDQDKKFDVLRVRKCRLEFSRAVSLDEAYYFPKVYLITKKGEIFRTHYPHTIEILDWK